MVMRVAAVLLLTISLSHIDVSTATDSFDVAAIKLSAPETPSVTAGRGVTVRALPGGRWTAQNSTLAMIIGKLYGLLPEQLIGGPPWLRTTRFDIVAKTAENHADSDINALARQLLADRFRLEFHITQRRLDVYALVLARPDGSLGQGLQPRIAGCKADDATNRSRMDGALLKDVPCGRIAGDVHDGVMQLRMAGVPLLSVLSFSGISTRLEHPAVDRTGLPGVFDIALDYAREGGGSEFGQGAMTAMERQLGLRLQRREELIDVTIVDRVEMPQLD